MAGDPLRCGEALRLRLRLRLSLLAGDADLQWGRNASAHGHATADQSTSKPAPCSLLLVHRTVRLANVFKAEYSAVACCGCSTWGSWCSRRCAPQTSRSVSPLCPAAYHPRHHSQRPAHLLRLRDFSGLFERERERERLLDGLRLLERLLDLLLRLRLRSERRLSRERERERERPPLLLPPGMPSPRSCLTRM